MILQKIITDILKRDTHLWTGIPRDAMYDDTANEIVKKIKEELVK